MSTRLRLTDLQIEQLLRARAATPDARLLDDILGATAALPHRTGGVGLYPQSRRILVLLAAALLLAALAGALALGMRLVEPRPSPLEPMLNVQYIPCTVNPETGGCTVRASIGGRLQLFPAGDPTCTAIGVETECFVFSAWFGTVRGQAALTNGDLVLTALECRPCQSELVEVGSVAGSVLFVEPRSGGEVLYVRRCEGHGVFCDEAHQRFARVGESELPWPPESDSDSAARYGWPGHRNVLTFTLPAGWDASGPALHKHAEPWVEDERVEITFVGTVDPIYTPQDGDVEAAIGAYRGWYRDEHPASLNGGRRQRWTIDIGGRWVVIQLVTGPGAPADHVVEAMQLLNSIRTPDDA